MNNLLTTLAALLALGGATAVAVLDSIPVLSDALTGAGAGAFVGGLVAYRRERVAARRGQMPTVEPRWLVTRWSFAGALVATAIHSVVAVL